METLLLTAYVMDDHESFTFIMKELVMKTTASFATFRRRTNASNWLPAKA
jgi:hypothetical protein